MNAKDRWGNEPLKDAIMHGSHEIVGLLRNAGAVLSEQSANDLEDVLIHRAAVGDCDGVRALVECGISVNCSDYDQRSALHVAAAGGHIETVCYLLSHGADLLKQDRWGRSAIADAIDEYHPAVCDALRRASSLFEGNLLPVGDTATLAGQWNPPRRIAGTQPDPGDHHGRPSFQASHTAQDTAPAEGPASADAVAAVPAVAQERLRLRMYCPRKVTVLFADIQGFTAACAAMSAREAGEWVAAFYERVDRAAAPYGIRKAEVLASYPLRD